MVLPENLELGKDFSSSYGCKFLSIQLDITPNRPDAFSHLGVARDIAAVTKEVNNMKILKLFIQKKEFGLNIKLENSDIAPDVLEVLLKISVWVIAGG